MRPAAFVVAVSGTAQAPRTASGRRYWRFAMQSSDDVALQLLALPGVSQSSLVRILRLAQSRNCPNFTDRKAIVKVLRRRFDAIVRYLPMQTVNGGRRPFPWPYAPLRLLLPEVMRCCPTYRTRFREALALYPNSAANPWNVQIYTDEVTPGNVLRLDNKRKTFVVHVGFTELGNFLQSEYGWLCVGVLRTSIAKKILGKESACFRTLFEDMYLGPESLRTVGTAIDVGDGPFMFYCTHKRIPCDEAAEKAVWDIKGASGIFCCMDCANIVAKQTDDCLADFDDGYLQPITCSDVSKFDPRGDAHYFEHYAIFEDLLRGGVGVGAFQQVQVACGTNYNPHGVLACEPLRSIVKPSSSHRDPMHILLLGVLQWEIHALLKAILRVKTDFRYADLQAFMQDAGFQFPSSKPKSAAMLRECFNSKRWEASKTARQFKGGASEMLVVYPCLRYFVETVAMPSGGLERECASYVACCEVVDLTQRAKRKVTDETIQAIRLKTAESLRLTKAAHGEEIVMPKHHYMVCHAFTRQMEEDGVSVDCFATERKGIGIKDGMDPVDNTNSFEKSVLLNVLAKCFGQAPKDEEGLHGGVDDCPVLSSVWGAPTQVCHGHVLNMHITTSGPTRDWSSTSRRGARHDHDDVQNTSVACRLPAAASIATSPWAWGTSFCCRALRTRRAGSRCALSLRAKRVLSALACGR